MRRIGTSIKVGRVSELVCARCGDDSFGGDGGGGGSCDKAEAESDGKTVVTVWYPFDSKVAEALKGIVGEFEKTHPGIHIKLSYASNNLTSSQKLFLAIAGGAAPDVTFVDGQQLAEWAARGGADGYFGSGEEFWDESGGFLDAEVAGEHVQWACVCAAVGGRSEFCDVLE